MEHNCTILFLYYPYHDINFRAHQMVSIWKPHQHVHLEQTTQHKVFGKVYDMYKP